MTTPTPVTAKPPMTLEMVWDGDLVFTGSTGDLSLTLDGRAQRAPSPMHAVAFGLAGCMAIDVANILARGRHPFTAITARLDAHRAAAQPSRFTRMDLHYVVTGAVPAEAVERAIALSREKYCSVWHSLRQDIEFATSFDVVTG
jgi:putative redox protein